MYSCLVNGRFTIRANSAAVAVGIRYMFFLLVLIQFFVFSAVQMLIVLRIMCTMHICVYTGRLEHTCVFIVSVVRLLVFSFSFFFQTIAPIALSLRLIRHAVTEKKTSTSCCFFCRSSFWTNVARISAIGFI